MAYATLGDIAEELRAMRADGMTRESIEYALGRVYGEPRQVKSDPARSRREASGNSTEGTTAPLVGLD